jgi:membrane-associated protein
MLASLFASIFDTAKDTMDTPWVYMALFCFSALDAFLPAVPSESLVISAGVFSAQGSPSYLFIVIMAGLGAFIGDHVSYAIGRRVGTGAYSRSKPDSRKRRALDWAQATLERRGGATLIVARYVPGGRTAVTLVMGTVRYPLRRFTFFDAIACTSWAVCSATIGYIGGASFEDSPAKGMLVGFAVAMVLAAVVELGHRALQSRRQHPVSYR